MKKKWLLTGIVTTFILVGAIVYYFPHEEELWQKREGDITYIESDYKLYEQMLIERKYKQIDCLPFRNVQLNGVANVFFIKSNQSKIYYEKENYKLIQEVKNQTLYLDFKENGTYGYVYVYTPYPIDTLKTVSQEYISGMLDMFGFENDKCHFIANNASMWLHECDPSNIQATLSNGSLEINSMSHHIDISIDMSEKSNFRLHNYQPTNLALTIKSHNSFFEIEIDDCTHIRKIDLQGSYDKRSNLTVKSGQPQLSCDTLILQAENNSQLPQLSIPYQTTIHYKEENF
ncbi:MAG: hypothetical protein LBV72_08440 [Tannerella sp.]|jgi:hypothetical protein|nr:hypothetical protein [Tannerella sp.]